MELWGSSYLLQDVAPTRLIATLGSSTPREAAGSVMLSFTQEPGVFTTVQRGSTRGVVMKWDLALGLMSLIHVLVVQNRLLRGETPELRIASERRRVFDVSGGSRSAPIECSWASGSPDVRCEAVVGGTDQVELVLREGAAAELVFALAERIARNGTETARCAT